MRNFLVRLAIFIIVLINVTSVVLKNGKESGRQYFAPAFPGVIPIIFPSGGSYKLVIGTAIPVALPPTQSMGWVLNLQFIHSQLTNLSMIDGGLPPTFPIRRKRNTSNSDSVGRGLAYMAFENIMDRHGLKGRECLLRTICDNALYNLEHDGNGLYGQVLNIIFTPEYDNEDGFQDLDEEYTDARKAGEYGVDCLSAYPGCPLGHGLLDLISILN